MSTTAPPDLVSVVVPCHNAEAFVADTLDSILAQSHPEVEAVVVDDASTDGSWAIVEGFVARHPDRVRALRLDRNRGGGHARNRGAELARGAYLMFLDADDVITPGALAALVAVARGRPGAIAVGDSAKLELDAGGRWVRTARDPGPPSEDRDQALRGWLESSWVPTCAVLWRRDAYEPTGGWDEELARNQDGDIAMRALVLGASIARTDELVGLYRMHGDTRVSVSRNFVQANKLQSQIRVLDRLVSMLEAQGRLPLFARSLSRSYHAVAMQGFQNGHWELGREWLGKGRALARSPAVSATPAGRALERVLGMERKERLVQRLAALGVMSRGRRTLAGLHARAVRETPP
ncbi:glycosyltransferase family A protein [Longimicrobium sp.]|jgi:glycosyltransferase involved in cell wall biosynthesis|uniref:glycosyltransferase family 2 protein n=1 Tax=Longimicrobium sp. TaxID=2029185 RepID=UPI002F946C59